MTRRTLLLAALLVASQTVAAQQPFLRPARVSFSDFAGLVQRVEPHRAERLVDFDTFLEMAQNENTIVLDSRSAFRYERIHLKGARHLAFTDFTQATLAETIPSLATRILIYCNNNFNGNEVDFATKIVLLPTPESEARDAITTNLASQSRPLMMALNVPTYINLFGYGYRNVYELNELVGVSDPRVVFEGSVVR